MSPVGKSTHPKRSLLTPVSSSWLMTNRSLLKRRFHPLLVISTGDPLSRGWALSTGHNQTQAIILWTALLGPGINPVSFTRSRFPDGQAAYNTCTFWTPTQEARQQPRRDLSEFS
ncbi:unnamed protein product [Ilex paraguariensis]|uniref:Uncharacterized protein n=1 Tax=Ilex paraguariensis TaxID=185542 RepID=A0ABC8UYK0_9AQUA